jgi:hypothetical protein
MSCSQKEFQYVTSDLIGKLKLETENPCWLNLFRSRNLFYLKGDEGFFCDFCNKLRDNIGTGNLMQLLEQTSSRVHQVIRRKSNNLQSVEQGCIALHFISLIINRFCSQIASKDVSSPYRFQTINC